MSTLICRDEGRRLAVREASLNGLDYVEVDPDDRRCLTVALLGKAPDEIRREHMVVSGGRRIRNLRVEKLTVRRSGDEATDDCLIVTLDRPGDSSTYTLCVLEVDERGRPTEEPLEGFDPRYACADFTFVTDCPGELDCKQDPACPPEARDDPQIQYLAKDYASFRRLILDRLSLVMPAWKERHVPDLGMTLVEMLAYVGDHLSYYQDAVATEAYIDTARERISIRRHARLVDYVMHEGCNARAWVVLETSESELSLDPASFYFRTTYDETAPPMARAEDLDREEPRHQRSLGFEAVSEVGCGEIVLREARNEVRIHTWGDADCCLPRGATSADLKDPGTEAPGEPASEEPPNEAENDGDSPAQDGAGKKRHGSSRPAREHVLDLRPCDVLVFEEVKGPTTGDPADFDPAHRHAVRLTHAEKDVDPLSKELIWHVEWGPEDALPFPVCVSAIDLNCDPIEDVTVLRGNVVLVDHGTRSEKDLDPVGGETRRSPCCDDCEPDEEILEPRPYAPVLDHPDLTHRQAPPPCRKPPTCGGEGVTSAAATLRQDPRRAVAQICLSGIPGGPDGTPAFEHGDLEDPDVLVRRLAHDATGPAPSLRDQLGLGTLAELDEWHAGGREEPLPASLADALVADCAQLAERWRPRGDLLDCGPEDRHFVVEMDEDRRAHLRFGTREAGCRPAAHMSFRACYRLGNGSIGNVGPESIRQIVFRDKFPSGTRIDVRNPMAAIGGTDPESVRNVKAFAPHAFRRVLARAVTADDYASIVMRDFGGRVQRAAATLRWTGSSVEVLVAIDPLAASAGDETLLCEIEGHLEIFRRIGHDLSVRWARYVSLHLAMTVCIGPGYFRGHVKAALLEIFGRHRRRNGGLGFFHPDVLSFGEGVQASEIVARAQAVDGVESVRLDRIERLYEGANGEIEAGVLRLGPLEIGRLDNDPNWPENGRLELHVVGGR